MTVRELMNCLSSFDPDMLVVFPDTYTREEGYGEGCDDAVLNVERLYVDDGQVVLDEE